MVEFTPGLRSADLRAVETLTSKTSVAGLRRSILARFFYLPTVRPLAAKAGIRRAELVSA